MKNTAKAGLLALVAGSLPFAGAANAEDAAAVTNTSSASTITKQQEIAAMSDAFDASRAHAKAGFNVGLVLHVGDDIPREQLQAVSEHFRNRYQSALDETFPGQNGTAQIFISPNPGSTASLLSADIGDQMFTIDNEQYGRPDELDPALMGLMTADKAAEDVISQIPAAKAVQLKNENSQTASLSSFTPG